MVSKRALQATGGRERQRLRRCEVDGVFDDLDGFANHRNDIDANFGSVVFGHVLRSGSTEPGCFPRIDGFERVMGRSRTTRPHFHDDEHGTVESDDVELVVSDPYVGTENDPTAV